MRPGQVVGLLLALVAAAVVLILAVVAPVVAVLAPGDRFGAPDTAPATLDEVRSYQPSREHVTGGFDYEQTPPVGGPHHPLWLECGVYDEPVADEYAVHSLEHGTVWITYDPGLDPGSVAGLAAVLPEDGILSPYPDLPAPVVATVWGRQLWLDAADDPRLALFLAEYGDGHTSPEPSVTCHGGVSDPSSGTAV